MARTREQTRDYSLGYQRATRRADQRWQKRVFSLIDALRKARRDLTGGMGRCRDCRHFARGGPTHHWGVCEAASGPTVVNWELIQDEGWARADTRDHRGVTDKQLVLSVHEAFGCTKFDRKQEGT
jgi:hypothetical protein